MTAPPVGWETSLQHGTGTILQVAAIASPDLTQLLHLQSRDRGQVAREQAQGEPQHPQGQRPGATSFTLLESL